MREWRENKSNARFQVWGRRAWWPATSDVNFRQTTRLYANSLIYVYAPVHILIYVQDIDRYICSLGMAQDVTVLPFAALTLHISSYIKRRLRCGRGGEMVERE